MDSAKLRTSSAGNGRVGVDANEAEPRLDTAKRLLRRGITPQRIPGVHGAQDGEVGVGVKALDKSIALEIEVAGDVETLADEPAAMTICGPGILAAAVGIAAEALVEQRRGFVADHGDLAG